MKYAKNMLFSILVAGCVAACGGGNAVAAPLDWNYTTASGVNFNLASPEVVSFEKVGIQTLRVITTQVVQDANLAVQGAAVVHDYMDVSFVTYNKVTSNSSLSNEFTKVGTSSRYVRNKSPIEVTCPSSYTRLVYSTGYAESLSGEGCAVWQAIKAVSNQ